MTDSVIHSRDTRRDAAIHAAAASNRMAGFMEHRWGQRKHCIARVCVSVGAGVAGAGRLRNVSLSGAFLETALPLPLFAQITIAVLRERGARNLARITATVVRRAPGGVGIEWNETADCSVCRLLGCAEQCAAVAGEHA